MVNQQTSVNETVNTTPSTAPDRLTELAVRSQRDPSAIEAFLAALQPRLCAMIYREVEGTRRHLSADEIADCLQEILISVWTRDLARFDPARGGFCGFIRRRVRWAVADQLRHRARQRSCSLEAAVEADALPEPEAVDRDPVSLNEAAVREATLLVLPGLVKRELDALADRTAAASILRHDVGGETLTAVARKFGLHASSATRARQRGLRFLERRLPAHLREAA